MLEACFVLFGPLLPQRVVVHSSDSRDVGCMFLFFLHTFSVFFLLTL